MAQKPQVYDGFREKGEANVHLCIPTPYTLILSTWCSSLKSTRSRTQPSLFCLQLYSLLCSRLVTTLGRHDLGHSLGKKQAKDGAAYVCKPALPRSSIIYHLYQISPFQPISDHTSGLERMQPRCFILNFAHEKFCPMNQVLEVA